MRMTIDEIEAQIREVHVDARTDYNEKGKELRAVLRQVSIAVVALIWGSRARSEEGLHGISIAQTLAVMATLAAVTFDVIFLNVDRWTRASASSRWTNSVNRWLGNLAPSTGEGQDESVDVRDALPELARRPWQETVLTLMFVTESLLVLGAITLAIYSFLVLGGIL